MSTVNYNPIRYHRIVLTVIVGCVCLFALFLGYTIFTYRQQRKNVLGTTTITPLKKDYLIFPQNTKYSSYYEPKPDTVEKNDFPWSAGSVTYTINADGLNERFNYQVQKPPEVYRIIALGDSFTFGHYVDTKDNWTELLEDKLNQAHPCPNSRSYEVLNLGVRGFDIDFAAERYRIRGEKYNPDLVIWFINNHNFYMVRQLVAKRENQILSQLSTEEIAMQKDKGNYYPAIQRALEEIFQQYPMERLVEQENAGLYDFAYQYSGPVVIVANGVNERFIALLKIFKNYRSAPTYIFRDISDINAIADAVLPDRHPSQLGHRLYATEIYGYLNDQHIVCK